MDAERRSARASRIFLVLWGVTAGLGVLTAQARPNILLIVSEDNGPELGCYGAADVSTPVLGQLATEGVLFRRAFVPQAGCSQSRAAFLTGLYPHQNGQIGLATWKFRMYRDDTPNVVTSLGAAGYRTGLIGKLHVEPKRAFPFDVHEIASSNFGRKEQGRYAVAAERFFTAGDEPFFLSVNYPDAHRPFHSRVDGLPEEPLDPEAVEPLACMGLDTPELRRQTAAYLDCMARLDRLVGDLLAALQRSGKADETLVVYIGDHGADLLRGKRTSYEGGLRIPFLLRWPGAGLETGQVREELVSTLDLLPTFLEAAGARGPSGLPGRSLLPLMRGEDVSWREYLFTEFHTHSAHNWFPQRTVRDDRYKLIRNLKPDAVNPGYAFTRDRFFADLDDWLEAAPPEVATAYRRMEQPPEFELYDLHADPGEFIDLAADPDNREVLERLQHELAAWRRRTRDPFLDPEMVRRLGAEIEACFVEGKPSKQRLELTYPDWIVPARR